MTLVPGCSGGALLFVRLRVTTWVVIVAKAVVRAHRVFFTSFRAYFHLYSIVPVVTGTELVAVALSYYCAPPFLWVEGGGVFLDCGGIIVREQKQREKCSILLPHVK